MARFAGAGRCPPHLFATARICADFVIPVQQRIFVQRLQRPARSSWDEPMKRVIGVLERILAHEGSSGYDPEGMIPPS
jgi:hypothetical protein